VVAGDATTEGSATKPNPNFGWQGIAAGERKILFGEGSDFG
jgi:hypothetical protein